MNGRKIGEQVLTSLLREKQDRLYAIVDCARSRAWFPLLAARFPSRQCLYAGEKARSLETVAPYLLEYEKTDHDAWLFLFASMWGTASLLCIDGRRKIDETRQHLKSIAWIEVPNADHQHITAYFRYYDPRVWCDFLQVATSAQLDTCFDDCITSTYAESAQGQTNTLVTRVRREPLQGLDALLSVNRYSAHQMNVYEHGAREPIDA